ncbi:LLM class flavin-dependent oxidoreductase [Frankia sp. QA3]|uniref:LLM class flavin-dependent oxidoreductase n=1 Tax=Frankia sp. QA3 TaxID=710111 RepID=UPI000269C733|nr:LLM class flavin-dependent oxidoreductase [Frankia sp. QA3]EIV94827.1 flavin-dependent oxidoreductase, F420-dependent methylene-tetrahydromethanopterin reductase [Frankia sp. QA3]
MTDTSAFRLGFFTRAAIRTDARQAYADAHELFVAADELGFDSGWVAQHHLPTSTHPLGGLPSPWTFLANVAASTRHIRLGTAVNVLPLEDPVRLAEDVAVVDLLSGGRVELGLGSGSDQRAYRAFGRDFSRKREIHTQHREILRRALGGRPLTEDGAVLTPCAPEVAEGRIWQGAHSGDTAEQVGREGLNLLLDQTAIGFPDRPGTVHRAWADRYRDVLPAGLGRRVAVCRAVFPAADRDTALRHLSDGLFPAFANLKASGAFPDLGEDTLDNVLSTLHIFCGHPEEVIERLAVEPVLPVATDLLVQFEPGRPSLDAALEALRLIATQVAPALGWRPRRPAAVSR